MFEAGWKQFPACFFMISVLLSAKKDGTFCELRGSEFVHYKKSSIKFVKCLALC
jgi:hypothetical protein